jgi:hypothetical protein
MGFTCPVIATPTELMEIELWTKILF